LTRTSENTPRSSLRQDQEGGVERLKQTDWDGPASALSDHRRAIEEHFRENPPRSTAQAAADIERLTGVRRGPTQVREFRKGIGLKSRKLGMIPAKSRGRHGDRRPRDLDSAPAGGPRAHTPGEGRRGPPGRAGEGGPEELLQGHIWAASATIERIRAELEAERSTDALGI